MKTESASPIFLSRRVCKGAEYAQKYLINSFSAFSAPLLLCELVLSCRRHDQAERLWKDFDIEFFIRIRRVAVNVQRCHFMIMNDQIISLKIDHLIAVEIYFCSCLHLACSYLS